ncbi:MAG TPA: hypothetical protein VGT82_11270 [Ktedonobacteraceae bacterium]|nr:hypothetical protein [Ktedonobacteraceae bacterium]
MMQSPNASHSISEHFTRAFHSLCEAAESYYYQSKLDEALGILRTALLLATAKEVQPRDRLTLQLQYGKILVAHYFLANRDFSLLLTTLQEAQQLAEETHDEKCTADALCLLGQACYNKRLNTGEGDYDEALTYFQQALKLRERLRDTRGISEALFHCGLIHEQCQLDDRALAYYTDALQFAELYNHKLEKSFALRHIAGIAWRKGELDEALNYALTSLALREEIGFRSYLPFSHLLVGDIYKDRNDQENALMHYQNAQALAEEMDIKSAQVFSLLALGDMQLAQQDVDQARGNFERAHMLAEELQLPYALEAAQQRLCALK